MIVDYQSIGKLKFSVRNDLHCILSYLGTNCPQVGKNLFK